MLVRDLKNHLTTVAAALKGANVPICGCVHFDHDRIWATNLEATIEIEADAGIDASVPAKALKVLLTSLDPKVDVSLDRDGDDLIVAGDGFETALKGHPLQDRPSREAESEVVATAKVEAGLASALCAVATACSTDDSRQVLTGVLVKIGDEAISLTSTDSYRLHHDELDAATSGAAAAIVPAHYFKLLGDDLATIIEVTDQHVRFIQGRLTITLRAIEGEYPSYRQLRPTSTTRLAVLGLADVESRLRPLEKLASNLGSNMPVVVEFQPDSDIAKTSVRLPDVGEHSTALAVDGYEGEGITIALNPAFFLAALRFAGGELRITDELKPVEIRCPSAPRRWALLMPVRLS
jgi:DNA polymerase-3 subunit beta